MIAGLCPPSIIYASFMSVHIIVDTFKSQYNSAFLKFWIMIVITILLNYLCDMGLGIVSWLLVSIPIIMMTVITSGLLYYFGLDKASGKIKLADGSITIDNSNTDTKSSTTTTTTPTTTTTTPSTTSTTTPSTTSTTTTQVPIYSNNLDKMKSGFSNLEFTLVPNHNDWI